MRLDYFLDIVDHNLNDKNAKYKLYYIVFLLILKFYVINKDNNYKEDHILEENDLILVEDLNFEWGFDLFLFMDKKKRIKSEDFFRLTNKIKNVRCQNNPFFDEFENEFKLFDSKMPIDLAEFIKSKLMQHGNSSQSIFNKIFLSVPNFLEKR